MREAVTQEEVGGCVAVIEGGHEFKGIAGGNGNVGHEAGSYRASGGGFREVAELEDPVLDVSNGSVGAWGCRNCVLLLLDSKPWYELEGKK